MVRAACVTLYVEMSSQRAASLEATRRSGALAGSMSRAPGRSGSLQGRPTRSRRASAGKLHRPHMRPSEHLLVRFAADPNHEGGACDASAHAAAHHEANPAHHLLFRRGRFARRGPAARLRPPCRRKPPSGPRVRLVARISAGRPKRVSYPVQVLGHILRATKRPLRRTWSRRFASLSVTP
jgi:hypothetical protein